jgi:hypothetical protein
MAWFAIRYNFWMWFGRSSSISFNYTSNILFLFTFILKQSDEETFNLITLAYVYSF